MNYWATFLLTCTLTYPLALAANCETTVPPTVEAVSQCDDFAKQLQTDKSECFNEAWFGSAIGSEEICYERTMNKLLDKRLLKLKSNEPKEFAVEMAIQKDFNRAVKKFCAPDPEMAKAGSDRSSGCKIAFFRYRGQQADLVNQESLKFTGQLSPRFRKAISREISAFAKSICTLPTVVWKEKAVPPRCLDDALGDLAEHTLTKDWGALDPNKKGDPLRE
jgi:hypothetical protein